MGGWGYSTCRHHRTWVDGGDGDAAANADVDADEDEDEDEDAGEYDNADMDDG